MSVTKRKVNKLPHIFHVQIISKAAGFDKNFTMKTEILSAQSCKTNV